MISIWISGIESAHQALRSVVDWDERGQRTEPEFAFFRRAQSLEKVSFALSPVASPTLVAESWRVPHLTHLKALFVLGLAGLNHRQLVDFGDFVFRGLRNGCR